MTLLFGKNWQWDKSKLEFRGAGPHPPQPPAATFKRLYRTREEHLARAHFLP